MSEEIVKLIQKAEHALGVAKNLLESRALLLSENIDVSKHSAVESALGRYFVKTSKMDSKYHRMFIEARNVREVADYDIDETIESETASAKLEDGKSFFSAVKNLLKLP